METKRIIIEDRNHIKDEELKEAARILHSGGLVAFPTETVYGLGGNALDEDAARKIYAAKDELIRILTSSLMDDNLIEESPDNVAGIIKDVDEYLFQEHADKCKILIFQNDERIENWTNLRKEEFILSIKDSSEIDDLRRQYQNETNFKEKIAIKKRIDELGDRQKEREQSFHKTVGIIEKEAQDMKVQFEENLLKRPVLFTKIVVKF